MDTARDVITTTGGAVIDFGGNYLDQLTKKPLQNLLGYTAGSSCSVLVGPRVRCTESRRSSDGAVFNSCSHA
jgi:hypothetical protein